MKKISEYRYVYENWYCKSCKKSNEVPVPFTMYLRFVPVNEVKTLKQFLDEGKTP